MLNGSRRPRGLASAFNIPHSTFNIPLLSLPPHPPPPSPRPFHPRQLFLLLLLDAAQERVHRGLSGLLLFRPGPLARRFRRGALLRIRALRILLPAGLSPLHCLLPGEGDLQVALRLPIAGAEAEGVDVVADGVVVCLRRKRAVPAV